VEYTHVVSTRYALLGGPGNSLVIGDQVTSLVLQAGSLIGLLITFAFLLGGVFLCIMGSYKGIQSARSSNRVLGCFQSR